MVISEMAPATLSLQGTPLLGSGTHGQHFLYVQLLYNIHMSKLRAKIHLFRLLRCFNIRTVRLKQAPLPSTPIGKTLTSTLLPVEI